MLTIYKNDSTKINRNERLISVEIRGLSTDTKPTQFEGKKTSIIDNGSTFIEMDTGKVYMYDLEHKKWIYPGEEEEKVKSMSFENNSYTIVGSGTIKLISNNFNLSDYDLYINSSDTSVVTIGNITKSNNTAEIELNVESDGNVTVNVEIDELRLIASASIIATTE